MSAVTNQQTTQPWGRACGVLVGGIAFVICVFRGVGPLEIALRTITVCVVTALATRGMIVVLGRLIPEEDEHIQV